MIRKAPVLALGLLLLVAAAGAQATGNAAAGKTKAQICVGCHGVGGNSTIPSNPILAGQSAGYIAKQLADFKSGARKEPQMIGIVAPLSETDMQDLGAYFAAQPIKPAAGRDEALAKRGERLYRGGNARTGVSACMSCHGPAGHGIPPRFPRVSGQHPEYTRKQLLAFKSEKRTNDDEVMTRIAFRMSESEIKAVSDYMAGLRDRSTTSAVSGK